MKKFGFMFLNFTGGLLFASGSLTYITRVIETQSTLLQAQICASSGKCTPSNIDTYDRMTKETLNASGLSITLAMIGAGFACVRGSKE